MARNEQVFKFVRVKWIISYDIYLSDLVVRSISFLSGDLKEPLRGCDLPLASFSHA